MTLDDDLARAVQGVVATAPFDALLDPTACSAPVSALGATVRSWTTTAWEPPVAGRSGPTRLTGSCHHPHVNVTLGPWSTADADALAAAVGESPELGLQLGEAVESPRAAGSTSSGT